ncbi:MAG: hypothetical protein AB7I42_17660 [Bradyrhizobium sp.]|uniref:hypothetical protein n=1 Tax=Bradyrhizobium sp. TaxID=376 RepID=UPI003D13D09F
MSRACQSHHFAHETVRKNPRFYCDDCFDLGSNFTTDKARERKAEFIAILNRAKRGAKRNHEPKRANSIHQIAQTLSRCAPSARCGTLTCPECSRAYQCARSLAHIKLATELVAQRPDQTLAFATIVPPRFSFSADELVKLDITAANRWFKDRLRRLGIRRPVVGSSDISWEGDRFQLHWHVGMMTSNRPALNKRLISAFRSNDVPKPAVVKIAYSHGFIRYSHKVIEAEDILRRARRAVPDLLLLLHRTESLSTMVLLNVRLSTCNGELVLRPISRRA